MELPIKIGIGSGVALLFGILFGWVGFPALLHHKITTAIGLKDGAEIREMYLKVPFPLEFRVFLFNVTNPEGVQKGDSPVLDEVGPFFYDEYKEKVNVIDNEADDTMIYNPKTTWIFNQEQSGKLTGNELITIPHPLIVGTVLAAAREKPAMLSLLNKAIVSIYHPENAFLTAPVKDILFDGIIINCTVTDFAAKGLCTIMKTEAKDLYHVSDTVFKFSFFGHKNGSLDKPFKVKRGVKNSHDVGRVIEFDGQKKMSVWGDKECDAYQGTDSTIFAPFLKPEEGLVSFAPDLCRSLPALYEKSFVYKGIPSRRYTATLGDMSKNKNEKCYCPTPDTCLKKGAMDLFKCVGAPVVTTLPHFFEADPSYLEGVRGLHPTESEHGIFIVFEPMTGTPLAARKRLQFNLPLQKIEKIALMKELPEALVPMFWVEEGVELNSTYINQIKSQLVKTLKVVSIIKWTIVALSLAGLAAAGLLYYKQNTGFTVTPTFTGNGGVAEPQKSSIINTITSSHQGRF